MRVELAEEEKQIPENDQNENVDESVRIIREVSASKEVTATNFTPDTRRKGDGAFHAVLCIGLIVVGVIMILLASFVKGYSDLFVGGVLFALLGLVLDFLSRKIKKD